MNQSRRLSPCYDLGASLQAREDMEEGRREGGKGAFREPPATDAFPRGRLNDATSPGRTRTMAAIHVHLCTAIRTVQIGVRWKIGSGKITAR